MENTKYTSKAGGKKKNPNPTQKTSARAKMSPGAREDQALPIGRHTRLIASEDSAQTPLKWPLRYSLPIAVLPEGINRIQRAQGLVTLLRSRGDVTLLPVRVSH